MALDEKIAIWIPMRPFSKWSGEGISRTIERIIEKASQNLHFEIVCLQPHASEIKENLVWHDNVSFSKIPAPKTKPFASLEYYLPATILKCLRYFALIPIYGIYVLFCLWYRIRMTLRKDIKKIWCPTFASLFSTANFRKEKIVNFWDGFVFEYPGFEDIVLPVFRRLERLLNSADTIITQSDHNKDYLNQVLDIPGDKIIVIPNPFPDLSDLVSNNALDDIRRDRRSILTHWHKKKKPGIADRIKASVHKSFLKRLADETDENSFLIMMSTQVRPYKGMEVLFANLNRFLSDHPDYDIRMIVTGDLEKFIHKNKVDFPWVFRNVYILSRVSSKNLALLYTLADLVMHPSYAEGGHGVYPMFEGASVGTPCLANKGRHMDELVRYHPNLKESVVDYLKYDDFAEKLRKSIDDKKYRDKLVKNVLQEMDKPSKSIDLYLSAFETTGKK